mgnify:CR=1 FL=1
MKPSSRLTVPRYRGYRIHVYRGAAYSPSSYTTSTMWRVSPPLEEWQRVISDPSTQTATMIESGRKMKQFQFRRNANSEVRR